MRGPLPPRVRILEPQEQNELAEPAFAAVFASSDPFGQPFHPAVEARALLFPVSFFLNEPQFKAFSAAVRTTGESTCYLQITEVADDSEFAAVLELPLDDFATYLETTTKVLLPLENALWSCHGGWGLLFSHEHHLLLGGPRLFVDTLLDAFPRSEDAPLSIEVTPDLEPWAADDSPDGEDLAAHYIEQGARHSEPLVGLSAREQVGAFVVEVRRWRDDWGTRIDWLPGLLEHLYGQQESRQLLFRAGLERED
jgi:hypothetical protein